MRGGAHPPLPFEAQMGPNDRGMLRNYRQLATYETAIRGFAICEAKP